MSAWARTVDFTARLAEAWDGIGRRAFDPYAGSKRALCALAWLPMELEKRHWAQLTEEQRRRLIVAARQGVELGRACAWVFGEGA